MRGTDRVGLTEDVTNRRYSLQLLTFPGCPLAAAARAEVQDALAQCGPIEYEEIDILDPATAEGLRGWGSPTILLDGSDITGQSKGDAVGCRVYPGKKKVPASGDIFAAIERARSANSGA